MKHFGIHNHNRHIACGMSKFQPVHKHNMLHHAHNIQKASSPCADFYQSAKPASNPQPLAQNAGQSQGAQQNFWQQLMGFLSSIFGGGNAAQSWESSTQALTGGAAAASAGGAQVSTSAAQATQAVQATQEAEFGLKDAIKVLSNNLEKVGAWYSPEQKDGSFSKQSIHHIDKCRLEYIVKESAVNPSTYSPELVKAAKFLLNDKTYFNMLSDSSFSNTIITKDSLAAAAKSINY